MSALSGYVSNIDRVVCLTHVFICTIFPLLQRVYAGLDDADGLMSVAKLRDVSTLEEQILDR
jgi:hypothetical protein